MQNPYLCIRYCCAPSLQSACDLHAFKSRCSLTRRQELLQHVKFCAVSSYFAIKSISVDENAQVSRNCRSRLRAVLVLGARNASMRRSQYCTMHSRVNIAESRTDFSLNFSRSFPKVQKVFYFAISQRVIKADANRKKGN